VVSFNPWPLYSQGKSPRCTLDRRLGGPQSRAGRFGEEKILDPSVVQPIASRYTDCAIPAHPKDDVIVRNVTILIEIWSKWFFRSDTWVILSAMGGGGMVKVYHSTKVSFRNDGVCRLKCRPNEINVFWVVTPRSLINIYRRFGEMICLHLQTEAASPSENFSEYLPDHAV
jgi:hypothetical protein